MSHKPVTVPGADPKGLSQGDVHGAFYHCLHGAQSPLPPDPTAQGPHAPHAPEVRGTGQKAGFSPQWTTGYRLRPQRATAGKHVCGFDPGRLRGLPRAPGGTELSRDGTRMSMLSGCRSSVGSCRLLLGDTGSLVDLLLLKGSWKSRGRTPPATSCRRSRRQRRL